MKLTDSQKAKISEKLVKIEEKINSYKLDLLAEGDLSTAENQALETFLKRVEEKKNQLKKAFSVEHGKSTKDPHAVEAAAALDEFDKAYQEYDSKCCAGDLTPKEEKQLSNKMTKSLNKAKKHVDKMDTPSEEMQKRLTDSEQMLRDLDCDGKKDEEEVFVEHDDRAVNFIGDLDNERDFMALWDREFTYNKGLSDKLMTPEYLEEIEAELKEFRHGHIKVDVPAMRHAAKEATDLANEVEKDPKHPQRRQVLLLRREANRLNEKLENMRKATALMNERLKEFAKFKREQKKEERQDERDLKKDGYSDNLERNKGDIPGYLDNAYYFKFVRASKQYLTDCNDLQQATYLAETMNRFIVQMTNELNDATCHDLLEDSEIVQINGRITDMRTIYNDVTNNCSLPLRYAISDAGVTPVRDSNGWIIGWNATRTIVASPNPDLEPITTWTNIYAAQPNPSNGNLVVLAQQPVNATPAGAMSPLNANQLAAMFGGEPGTQTMPLQWRFGQATAFTVTFEDNTNNITGGRPTDAQIDNWILAAAANPNRTFRLFGDTAFSTWGENQAVWDTVVNQTLRNTAGINLNNYTIGSQQPAANLFNTNTNVGTLMLWRAAAVAELLIDRGFPAGQLELNAGNDGAGMQVRIQ